MNHKITLKDSLHQLIAENGSVETAERYKSIYEDFDQDVYGKAVGYLECFLQEILDIENKNSNEKSPNITLSEAVRSSESTPNLHPDSLQENREN